MPTIFNVSTANQYAIERSTWAVDVSFTDETGAALIPDTLTWSLTKGDRATIVNSRDDVVATPAATVTIVLSGADLALDANQIEWRYLIIEGTFTSSLGSGLPFKDHLKFPILDLAKVPS